MHGGPLPPVQLMRAQQGEDDAQLGGLLPKPQAGKANFSKSQL